MQSTTLGFLRGPWGSFRGPGGPGRSWGGSGGPREVLNGSSGVPWRRSFSFCLEGEFVNSSNGILMFSVSCDPVKRSVVIRLFQFLLFLEAYIFTKQFGEYVMNTIAF